jgi:hypothetical protein
LEGKVLMLRIVDDIEVKTNISLILRERGKVVARRECHNIFLATGSEWLAELVSLQSYSPDVAYTDHRIKYMGLGIGGTQQLALDRANNPPITPPYGGTNTQTDEDATVTSLERPVRISGSDAPYPGIAGDAWVAQLTSSDPVTTPGHAVYTRIFTETEINYGAFDSVPLSEVALFTAAADPENYQNVPIAYDTFDTLSKTAAFVLEAIWTLRF